MSVLNNGPQISLLERVRRQSVLVSLDDDGVRSSRPLVEQQDDRESMNRQSGCISDSAREIFEDNSDSDPSSTLTDRLPALTRGSSITSSPSSAHPGVESARYILESEDGVLMLPRLDRSDLEDDLLCPFQILDCAETFSDIRDFKTHVFSHFRGHPTLPMFAPCFLCNQKFQQTAEEEPAMAWNLMLSHMVHQHFRQGEDRGTIRADFKLMRWMYDRKIIDDKDFKRTQVCPQPVVFPVSGGVNSVSIEVNDIPPLAPSPPRSTAGQSSQSSEHFVPRTLSTGYHGQAYVTFAGPRAERRRRESLRPAFQRYARTMG